MYMQDCDVYSDDGDRDFTESFRALPISALSPLTTHGNASRLPHMSVNASWEAFADPENHPSSQVGASKVDVHSLHFYSRDFSLVSCCQN